MIRVNYNSFVSWSLGISTALLLVVTLCGCGVESSEEFSGSSSLFMQSYSARLAWSNGLPASDVQVTISAASAMASSDQNGLSSIEIPALSGNIEVVFQQRDWGTSSVVLPDIGGNEESIIFDVELDSNAPVATLRSITSSPSVDLDEGSLPISPSDVNTTPSTDQATPTPIETPNATTDSQNQTAAGKAIFRSTCGQCHALGKADGYNKSRLQKALSQPQHASVRLSTSKIDDLLVYLNR
ncbi:MAG: hypothetical protein KDD70_01545 [Bdellovibrionales bacterium]|nr:hypothetical protein [Bdellovibrionales bacterium]